MTATAERVDIGRIYAFYYREKANTSSAVCGRIVADSIDEARGLAVAAVAEAFPVGKVFAVGLAKKSPWPVRNANGELCAPSEVY